ncbi:MAG: class I SAM-dependent methyltransferase [Actinomycetota bacterium]|nr:class I SAM-dependent methyltransferase [Actinomycetota bacterium]
MRPASDLTADKLRGGYYTPDFVVDACISRAVSLSGRETVSVLEPSAGDGAFVRGLARSPWAKSASVACVEKSAAAAQKCSDTMRAVGVQGDTVESNFFEWATSCDTRFDCVLGNPPFVRYQFVPSEDRVAAERLLEPTQVLAGVSNLYIPFVLVSLMRLIPGGAFAMVLPSEVLCTTSGEQARAALLAELEDLQVDLFPREAFPDILQDVAVFTGRKRTASANSGLVRFVEHSVSGTSSWSHRISLSDGKWTRFLLDDRMLAAIAHGESLSAVHRMAAVAKFSVSIVTGANAFFAVDRPTIENHGMSEWAKPLMSRSYDSPGIVFRDADHSAAASSGRPAWLLDFDAQAPDPETHQGAMRYLRGGEAAGLATRYKCRIRSPWYRVPHIWPGRLMMSKRASLHHRVILNEASVLTTDTVYRGKMQPEFCDRERDFVAGFHNSLTLLSSEIEGRTYGGGVLELVPSEIARLLVPMLPTNGDLEQLDALSRDAGGQRDADERLVHETNRLLSRALPEFAEIAEPLETARQRLRRRRFDEP